MTQTEINGAISQAFANLSILNEQVYDYWVSELYTLDGDFVEGKWNEETLYEMETDVMQNSWMYHNWIIAKKRDKTLFFYVFSIKNVLKNVIEKIKSFSITNTYWESIRGIVENKGVHLLLFKCHWGVILMCL